MKRVLVVIQLIRRGGVELVAINFARNLNPKKFKVTFLLINPNEHQDEELAKELLNEGFEIMSVPKAANSYLKKYKYLNSFFANNSFDAVHSHVMFFSAFVCKAAKNNGVPVRLAHSHAIKWNSKENFAYKIYKRFMRAILNRNASHKIGCCRAAGEFLFGASEYQRKGTFIANGINTEKFAFNNQHREDIRNELGIDKGELLVGHVGTIYRIKNQTFLVEIFAQMVKLQPKAKLLLVGEEVDVKPVVEKAKTLNVYDKIIFAGQRSDIFKFYSAFDIMIFPSLHEALPVSLIEAQASRLPCLISNTVTTEVKFNDNVSFLSLSDTPAEWSHEALKLMAIDRNEVSTTDLYSTYDISNVISQLERIYEN